MTSDAVYIAGIDESGGSSNYNAFLAKFNQDGSLLWSRTFGGGSNELGYGVTAGWDGVYLAGWTLSYGAGDADAFIAKYDENGDFLWFRTWGGPRQDTGQGVALSSDGVYLVGTSFSYGPYGSAFVTKYSSTGSQLWNRTWTFSDGCGGESVATGDDGVYVGGYKSYPSTGSCAFIAKYSPTGDSMWNRTFGGPTYGEADGVAVGADGVYMTGFTQDGSNAAGFLAKYTTGGVPQWNRLWYSDPFLAYTDVATSGNRVCITGYTYNTNSYPVSNDALLLQYDTEGVILWNITVGGANDDVGKGIASLGSTVCVVGETDSFGAGYFDAFLLKYNDTSYAPPPITHPADITYTAGQVKHAINWTITSATTGTRAYTIYCNELPVANGTWTSGLPVQRSVEGLGAGTYNFTIIATDGLGGTMQDTVMVIVVPNVAPVLTYVVNNETSTISWIVDDTGTGTTSFSIYCDLVSLNNGTWTHGQVLTVYLLGFASGVHNLTIVVDDGLGGKAQHMALVVIPIENPGNDDPPREFDPANFIVLVILLAAGVFIIVTAWKMKHKETGNEQEWPFLHLAPVHEPISEKGRDVKNTAGHAFQEYEICPRCGNKMPRGVADAGVCSYCGEHFMPQELT